MSDIEILEVIKPNQNKRKQKNKVINGKRKRTSSGLIEMSGTMKGTETEFKEFVIDRTITPQRKLAVADIEKSAEGAESVSQWRKNLESTLLGSVLVPITEKKPIDIRFKKSCFNCDGEHNLRDCTRPKDFRRISRKKLESRDAPRRKHPNHDSVGLSKQKQNNFKPGEISEQLRSALGLNVNDIPEHVYRMRRLGFIKGYPPGWLRKAIKSKDTLKFYTSDSNCNDCEKDVAAPELDMSKIAMYPGFNGNDSNLNDRESFKAPPTDVFCMVYQEELTNMFRKERKVAQKKTKLESKHTKFVDDNDVTIIEQEETKHAADRFITPGEESTIAVLEGYPPDENNDSSKTPIRKNVKMGESLFELIGTPTFNRRKLIPVAPLEAFAVGIQPFVSDPEEGNNKGAFKRLMEKLKEARAQLAESKPELEILEDAARIDDYVLFPSTENGSISRTKSKRKEKSRKIVVKKI